MKRDYEQLDLKDAFAPTPESCKQALFHAVSSVKEEEPVKRASFRTALIAAVIILATMAVAFAADQLGMINLFGGNDGSIQMPQSAQDVVSSTEQKTYTVGPLTVTLRELMADGRTVYCNTLAKPTDGQTALIDSSCCDLYDYLPDSEQARLSLGDQITYVDAAKAKGIPLYMVSSFLTVDLGLLKGEEMQTALWDADGSALLVDMLQTDPAKVGDTLTGVLTIEVSQYDPVKEAYIEGASWRVEDEISIPVSGVTAEKTYAVESGELSNDYTVESIKAEQTCEGVYMTVTLTAGEGAKQEDVHSLYDHVVLCGADGQPIPDGINFSGSIIDDAWPTVTWEEMKGIDALPDEIHVKDAKSGQSVILK